MAYSVILADIDNTLLDFTAGSHAAIRDVLEHLGVAFTQERLEAYQKINHGLWEAYERGEVEKQSIYTTRFALFLDYLGLEGDPVPLSELYRKGLKTHVYFMPHCLDFLEAVHGRYKLYAVTNGDTSTQEVRLATSGIGKYFDGVFISEQMGSKKPLKAYFDKVFDAIGPVRKEDCILLGDSLTSDMQGGRNAGVATCYIGEDPHDDRCDYVIGDLMELLPILEA